ncbi:hypothetical protein [Spirosoma endophyticum]|uniref:Endonuclease, Uma2 family (Restriction endonuclease fold) n=1 Tax=Spirosoma endophyticum TaxID=662367 RepID=A0A1I1WDL6_9BACT|nr:hypothetical protein [Spirosoma endophyticum]SFD93111.1 hypothetical protein SAMN05216167_108235 [Spirosoma endophyticum]
MWDGKPVYYAGYEDVLKGIKTVEQVRGSSILQSRLVVRLSAYLLSVLNLNVYDVLGNEVGIQFKKGDWQACNIAIFELEILEGQDETKYAWVPPKVAIEIDTKADMDQYDSAFDYYEKKTTKLLDCGVEKVIWLFTKSRKVWIAEANKDWIIWDWSHPVDVLPGCQFVPDTFITTSKK